MPPDGVPSSDLTIVDGASAGAWIEPRLGGEFGAVTLEVPKGYETYARVFHPASDAEWNPVRWVDVAKVCGTTVHREMQWHAIVGLAEPEDYHESKWAGQSPETGSMDIADLDALCEILAAHTADPEDVFFGLCTIELWEESFMPEELKKNRLLRLPMGRDHIVLAGSLSAVDQLANDGVANPGPLRTRHDAPNLIWPADHTWLLSSEVDFDSTLVGGSAELIQAIVDSSKLEAWQVEPADSLAVDADKINTPKQA